MAKGSSLSKGLAIGFVVLTASAIAGMVTMVILFEVQREGINVTAMPDTTTPSPTPPPLLRLPKTLVPEMYQIHIQTHLYSRIVQEVNVTSPNQTTAFRGNVTVHFHTLQRTDLIYLHCRDLEVSAPRLLSKDYSLGVRIKSLTQYRNESEFLVVQLEEYLPEKMNFSLFLKFEGNMSEYLDGLFVSTYREGNPQDEEDTDSLRYLAATSLQPTSARTLFPCFDEPEMKAVFQLTLIHRSGTFALGNTDPRGDLEDEWMISRFEPTERMSTYLFGFVVSEFKFVEWRTSQMRIHTYARPEAIAAGHADYASNITGKILTYYENFFGILYRPNWMVQVALPDLNSPGMENWGIITYQESSLLYQEGVSSLLHKKRIASVIAHELAHYWFGNLVTMRWWNDLWLSEALSSYMSLFGVDQDGSQLKVRDIMIMENLHKAFEEDALNTSRPVTVLPGDVQTPSEIMEMFDTITYSKGALLLRMLADYVGELDFNNGLKSYLRTFRGGTAETSDLWRHIEEARNDKASFTVSRMMRPWTEQQGYPVITINTTSGAVYQKQFLFDDSITSHRVWPIPIYVRRSDTQQNMFLWLEVAGPVRKGEFVSPHGWILANVDCVGFYRVNYDVGNWQRLMKVLDTSPLSIPLMNRAQLIDDAFHLTRARQLDVTVALNMTYFLKDEIQYLPWEAAVRNLEYLFLMFDRSEVYGLMQKYLCAQVSGLYDFFSNQTIASEVPKTLSLQHSQILSIEVACSNRLPECTEMAQTKFAQLMDTNSTNSIHVNLRPAVYCQAVAAGGQEEWEFAWDRFMSSNDTSEKAQLRHALSCSRKTWLLNRLLEYALDPSKIRLSDVASVVEDVAKNPAGQALAWNYIRAHWDYVSQGDSVRMIEAVTRRFSTKFEVEELERFATDYNLGHAFRAVLKAIEETQVNMEWVSKNKQRVLEWFEGATAALDDK